MTAKISKKAILLCVGYKYDFKSIRPLTYDKEFNIS